MGTPEQELALVILQERCRKQRAEEYQEQQAHIAELQQRAEHLLERVPPPSLHIRLPECKHHLRIPKDDVAPRACPVCQRQLSDTTRQLLEAASAPLPAE